MSDIAIATTLSPAQCLARLEAAASADDWLDFDRPPGADPIGVALDGHRLTVRNLAEGAPPQMFRRVFQGHVVECPGGAQVAGRFALAAAARTGLVLWFASMAAIVALVVAANATGSLGLPPVASGWLGAAVPVTVLAAAALLVRASLAQSRPREAAIVTFLKTLLDAHT